MNSTIKLAAAAALALGLSTAAFAQGGTVGGPSAAGAPQPATSQPDSAQMGTQPTMGAPMKSKKGMAQPEQKMNMGSESGKK